MASVASFHADERESSFLGDVYKGSFASQACQYHPPPRPERHPLQNAQLVDKVIDELDVVTQPFYGCSLISNFSTVSRQWVERTQKHHFRQIWLYRRGTLEQWRTTFDADPCGPSRHVRQLELGNIVTFQGFEDHLRAFTQVEEVHILGGWILESVPEVQRFTMIGSNLKSLRILSGWTTPQVVVSLLAGLPHLRSLDICITFDCGFIPPVFPPSIPFFEGANTLFLRGGKYCPGSLDWIPSTARLGGLSVDIRGIHLCLAPVNRLLASSGETLEWFTIGGDDSPTGTSLDPFCSTLFSFTPLNVVVSFQISISTWTSRIAHL